MRLDEINSSNHYLAADLSLINLKSITYEADIFYLRAIAS